MHITMEHAGAFKYVLAHFTSTHMSIIKSCEKVMQKKKKKNRTKINREKECVQMYPKVLSVLTSIGS